MNKLAIAIAFCWLAPVASGEPFESALLNTVGVAGYDKGKVISRGFGSIVRFDDDWAYVLTTASAVSRSTITITLPEGTVTSNPGDEFETVTVSVFSDPKRPKLKGELLARDIDLNLAVLRIPYSREKGAAVDIERPMPALRETSPLAIFGLAERKISKKETAVSALRRAGTSLDTIQIDQALPFLWLGAPAFASEGSFVGLVTGTTGGTGISFVTPVSKIASFLAGTHLGTQAVIPEKNDVSATIEIKLMLNDPFEKLSDFGIRLSDESGRVLAKATLERAPRSATGNVKVSGEVGTTTTYRYHVVYKSAGGAEVKTESETIIVEFGETQAKKAPAAMRFGFEARARKIVEPNKTPRPLLIGGKNIGFERLQKTKRGYLGRSYADLVVSSPSGVSYHLDLKCGSIGMMKTETAIELRRLFTPAQFALIGLNKEGLILNSTEINEVWVLSAKTLEVKRRFGIALGKAYQSKSKLRDHSLVVDWLELDLRSGTVRKLTGEEFSDLRSQD